MITPNWKWPARSSVAMLPEGDIKRINIGPLEFIVSKRGDNILIWPGLCPHEGAKLEAAHFCKEQLCCPWHGRKFRPVALNKSGEGHLKYLNFIVKRDENDLVINEAISKS
jgi:nitrite reductase/ring-hydroxylating ferredoxin subunit